MERPSPLSGIAKSWIAVFGFVFIFLRELVEGGLDSFRAMSGFMVTFGIFTGAIMLLTLGWGIIEWRTTRFVADEHEFRIERNFLSRNSRRISYPKIQSVDISRSLVARILGLSAVSIDVGGDESTKLEFLTAPRADALRDHLLKKMRSLTGRGEDAPDASGATGPTSPPPGTEVDATPLLHVTTPTLVLGTLVSTFLPILLAATAGVAVLWGVEGPNAPILFPFILGVGGYLFSNVVGNINFRIERVTDGLRISKGLFTQTTRSLRADRIQAVAIKQDAIQRLTGLYRVNVTVLGGGLLGSEAQTSSTVLPYGRWEDVRTVLAAFWPGIDIDSIPLAGQPDRARWLTPLAFPRHRWGFDEHGVVSHRGWLSHLITLVPHRRMQSIGISQGPIQRRLRLATIDVHVTTGPVTMLIEHMDQTSARPFLEEQVERARVARETPGEPRYLSGHAPDDPLQRVGDAHEAEPPTMGANEPFTHEAQSLPSGAPDFEASWQAPPPAPTDHRYDDGENPR